MNVSRHTLEAVKCEPIARRKGHGTVLDAIHATPNVGLKSVKINVVLMNGVNDGELAVLFSMTEGMKVDAVTLVHRTNVLFASLAKRAAPKKPAGLLSPPIWGWFSRTRCVHGGYHGMEEWSRFCTSHFRCILHDSVDFERPIVDGILGMGYEALACNPTCVEPPFQ